MCVCKTVCVELVDIALLSNLNLSGGVKGRALGMRLKYPKRRKRPRESYDIYIAILTYVFTFTCLTPTFSFK